MEETRLQRVERFGLSLYATAKPFAKLVILVHLMIDPIGSFDLARAIVPG